MNILASWTFLRWHLSEFSTPAFPFPPFLRVASILWSPGCDHSMDSLRICIQHLFLTFGWIPEGWQSRFLYPVLIPWQIRSASETGIFRTRISSATKTIRYSPDVAHYERHVVFLDRSVIKVLTKKNHKNETFSKLSIGLKFPRRKTL